MRRIYPIGFLLLVACRPGTDSAVTEFALVDGVIWEPLPESEDPLPDHRPDEVVCSEAAWYPELGGLEVDTALCNYVSLTQPLQESIAVGDGLEVLAWHQSLWAEEAAQAHVAILVNGKILWEQIIDIPGDAAIYDGDWKAETSASAGSPVVLHLHNHGYNSWQFNALTVTH